jgi:hypothetical protein
MPWTSSSRTQSDFSPRLYTLATGTKDLVKFSNDQDHNYELVSSNIYDLVKRTLPAPSMQPKPAPVINFSSYYDEDKEIDVHVLEGLGKTIEFATKPGSGDQPTSLTVRTQETGSKSRESSISLPKDTTIESRKAKLPQETKSTNQNPGQVDDIKGKETAPAVPPTLTVSSESSLSTDELVESLREYHTVFIIDDTKSMQDGLLEGPRGSKTRWDQLIEAMEYLGDLAARGDDQGVDMHFIFDRKKDTSNIRKGEEITKLLAKVHIESSGDAPLHEVLWEVLNEQLSDYRRWRILQRLDAPAQAPKPLNLIVLTDGCTEDRGDVEGAIFRIARRLDTAEFRVRVEFLQVGDDAGVKQWLNDLEDRVRGPYGRKVSLWLHRHHTR